jgi:plasmid replication initiation protein
MDRTITTEPRSTAQALDLLDRVSAPHQQREFFIADILDPSLKDDLASMEHPFFALKAGDHRIRSYEHNGVHVEVQPGAKGMATIHDKDVWIYCISQLVEGLNRGRCDPGREVHFTAYSFLAATNRGMSGTSYNRLGTALERLRGTSVVTNIETDGLRERNGFGLIESFRIVQRSRSDNRMVAVSVTLPDWLYRSIFTMQVKTLSRDYFKIRKPLDRRVYELARKHCGNQPQWRVSMEVLHAKSGSTSTLRKFRLNVKALASAGNLPDYRVMVDDERDTATFFNRGPKGAKAQLAEYLKSAKSKHLARVDI